jgi:hypothetical protein
MFNSTRTKGSRKNEHDKHNRYARGYTVPRQFAHGVEYNYQGSHVFQVNKICFQAEQLLEAISTPIVVQKSAVGSLGSFGFGLRNLKGLALPPFLTSRVTFPFANNKAFRTFFTFGHQSLPTKALTLPMLLVFTKNVQYEPCFLDLRL